MHRVPAERRSDNKANVRNKGGAPKGNKNASGPPGNRNAVKHGFFSKQLTEDMKLIIQDIENKTLIDVLWENIQIAYAAIIRAQNIMYVRDKDDSTTTKIGESFGAFSSEKWEVQQAWDKQANFMKAQACAQSELRSLIKQYDELVKKNQELATEEQRARINALKATINLDGGNAEDGFIRAIRNENSWNE